MRARRAGKTAASTTPARWTMARKWRDLSSGQQPMGTADGQLWVSFNGEIFNYVELNQELAARGLE